jgi:phosphosulfolactate synthase (CoM biosynthesis protein A)
MPPLKVDPAELQNAAELVGRAAEGLSGLQADAPLADAAAAVSRLQTAEACRKAQADVAAQTAAVADGARHLGENLGAAARWYEIRDEAAAEAIQKIDIPK